MVKRIAIAGDGQMALVLAESLARSGHDVKLWCPLPGVSASWIASRRSERLPELRIPDSVVITDNPAVALSDATMVVSAIPSQFARSVWERLASHVPSRAGVVTVTKGVEVGTMRLPREVLRSALGNRPFAVLSGPTIARELAQHKPAVMVAASDESFFATEVQTTFAQPWLRIYTSDDPIGVEIAGAAKNVVALAAGILDGLDMGFNAKSALLARGLAESVRVGMAMGARMETFFGVVGVGDLATTCFCPEGRNRSFGEAIGRGSTTVQALAASTSVVEGVETARALLALGKQFSIRMPIIESVNRVLFEGKSPIEAVHELMGRDAGAEHVA